MEILNKQIDADLELLFRIYVRLFICFIPNVHYFAASYTGYK